MPDLLKCMECGGMVSSEADKCPHCNTGRDGIRGVNCKVCGGLLKFSECYRYYFHDSCYQQVTRKIVERKKTINCPVCAEPNQFSYAREKGSNVSR